MNRIIKYGCLVLCGPFLRDGQTICLFFCQWILTTVQIFKFLCFIRCRPCSFRVINENNAHFKLFLKNLFYNFRSKKKIKYRSNENCHKWKMLYSYPVLFCKRYCSKIYIYIITTSRIMILQERHWANFYITVALYVHYFRPFDVLKKLSFQCFMSR